MQRDCLGRRRRPGQERGLRPLHPALPEQWTSRALRIAMPEGDWGRFEALARTLGAGAPTLARSYGQALSTLLHAVPVPEPTPGPLDWMDWERRKALRLLVPRRG